MTLKFSKKGLTLSASVLAVLSYGGIANACPPGGCGNSQVLCEYDASPQGFKYNIAQSYNPDGSASTAYLTIQQVTPKYFTATHNTTIYSICPGPNDPSQVTTGSCLIGTQNTGNPNGGLFNGGTGFAHDAQNGGLPIDGNVYVVRNNPGNWAVYQGGTYTTPMNSPTSSTCTQFSAIASALNVPSPNRPPNMGTVPAVNGASQSWMDHSPIMAYSGPVYGNNPPDMNFSQMIDPGLLSAYLQGAVNNDWGDYVDLRFPSMNATLETHSRAEIESLAQKYDDMGMGSAFAAVYRSNFTGGYNYQLLNSTYKPSLTIAEMDDDDEVLLLTKSSIWLKELVVTPPVAGSFLEAKNIYPSSLYDKPKSRSWYAGNSMAPGSIGAAQTYNHDPLPDSCNPDSDDYVPAAFLHSNVLEELRQDWRYLSLNNIADLKAKNIDFHTQSAAAYTSPLDYLDVETCNLDGNSNSEACLNSIVSWVEEDGGSTSHIQRPELPLQTISKDHVGKFVPLRKTEAYFDNLINQEMITMNPAWSQSACRPKRSAAVRRDTGITKPLVDKPIVEKPVKIAPVVKKPVVEKRR